MWNLLGLFTTEADLTAGFEGKEMTNITPNRQIIQIEETQFRAAVSEAVSQKIGGSINFALQNFYIQKEWFIPGYYSAASGNLIPASGVGGLHYCFNNTQIVNAFMYTGYYNFSNLSHSMSLDIRAFNINGSSSLPTASTSIFTTLPAITYLAGSYAWVSVGNNPNGINAQAPVLNPAVTALPTGTALMCNLIVGASAFNPDVGIILQTAPM